MGCRHKGLCEYLEAERVVKRVADRLRQEYCQGKPSRPETPVGILSESADYHNEPHTCPTCDGYGYVRRAAHRRFFSYHKVEDCSEVEDIYDVPGMVPRLVDIPCPKCESDAP